MSGPPVVLFFANQQLLRGVFRANLAAFFFVLNLVANATFLTSGLTDLDTLRHAALLAPGVVAGVMTGIRFSSRLSETLFRRLALAVVTVAGLLSIFNGLGLL